MPVVPTKFINDGLFPSRRNKMNKAEKDNRYEALNSAVRHKARGDTAEDIVQNAKKYLAFLEGEKKE